MGEDGVRKNVIRIYHPESSKEATAGSIRVAAYCRVSTKSQGQRSSFETQKEVYARMVKGHEGWALAGIYADHGLTGTRAISRPHFQQMISDCREGKIDLILCKSISRFSRNTMEALQYIRSLQEMGVRLIFEKEGIDTGTGMSEMLLTVLAAFAQEESRSLSENVKWGKRKRMQDGRSALYPPYGFCKSEDGRTLSIIPEEAKVVRRIFDLYEKGTSVNGILRLLMNEKIKPPGNSYSGSMVWDKTRIDYIIQNEKYIGDIKTQKSFREDHITHRLVRNDGRFLPQYYYHGTHTGIITKKQYERCNMIRKMRLKTPFQKYPYGEYIRCPFCGHVMTAHKLGTRYNERHFCCEGDGACRKFVFPVRLIESALLTAYKSLPMDEVKEKAHGTGKKSEEAEKLLAVKKEYGVFFRTDYWWLEELVEWIELGRHTWKASDLEGLDARQKQMVDDRTITIYWRCGIRTALFSGVATDAQDPLYKAGQWDSFLLKNPDRYPWLTKEVMFQTEGQING